MILSHFNKTYAIETRSWKYWHIFFVVEIGVIAFSIFFVSACLYANEKTKKFHLNLRVPVFWFYLQYDFQAVAWIVQRYLILTRPPEEIDTPSDLYIATSYVRLMCGFAATFVVPIIVIERAFATYHFRNYEYRRRPYLCAFLLISLMFSGFSYGIAYHRVTSTIPMLVFGIFANMIAILANAIILKTNYYLFDRFGKNSNFKRYSLTERFQISENIKVCKAVFKSLLWICTANTIACSSMVADNFQLPMWYDNLSGLVVDLAFFWYVFTIPLKMFFVGEVWMSHFKSVMRMLRPRVNPLSLKNSLDNAQEETNRYFDMLTSQWEGGANRKNQKY